MTIGALLLAAATSTTSASLDRTTVYGLLGYTENPQAIALFAGFEKKYHFDLGEGVLWKELHHQYGAEVLLSGLLRPALFAEVSPIKIFKLRLQYEFWIWPSLVHGRGHGLIFDGKGANFAPEELERRSGEEVTGVGHRLALLPTLQLKLWRVVVINTFELASWYVHGPRSYWREPNYDNLIKRGDVDGTVRNFSLLLFELWTGAKDERVMAGGSFEVVRTLSAGITRHRAGLAFIATPFRSLFFFDRPALLVLVGMNTKDNNREDEFWINAGIRLERDL